MRQNLKICLVLAVVVLASSPGYGQGLVFIVEKGRAGGACPFLKTGVGTKALAMTVIDLLEDQEKMKQVKDYFNK